MRPIIVVTSEDPDFRVRTQHPVVEADFAKNVCDKCMTLEATDAEPVKCIKTVSLSAITVFFYYGLKLGLDVSFWMMKKSPKSDTIRITRVGIEDIFASFNKEYEHVENFFGDGEYGQITDRVMANDSGIRLSYPEKETYNLNKFYETWSIGVCTDLELSFRKH